MEVQVQFMMIKEDMKLLSDKIFLAILLMLVSNNIASQDWNAFHEKDKAAKDAERKGDYAIAASISEEIIGMSIITNDKDDSRIKYKGDAYFRLGHYYFHAHHFPYDINKAISNFEKAAYHRNRYAQAEMYLAMIYNLDSYGVKDLRKSFEWIEKGANRMAEFDYMMAEVYEKGFTFFLTNDTGYIDENGRRIAASNVRIKSNIRLDFPNISQNIIKAYESYYKYFERGGSYIKDTRITRYEIGVALMEGTYLEKDYSKAFEYFRYYFPSISELSTNLEAYQDAKIADVLWRLSVLYRFGLGTTDNEERANQYLKYAALCGSVKAQRVIDAGIIKFD